MKKALYIVTFVTVMLFILSALQLTGVVWSKKELLRSCQPETINYNSYDPYCLMVYKLYRPLNQEYLVLIAKKVEPNYGFMAAFPNPTVINEEREVSSSIVSWSQDGVTIETDIQGLRLFIPQKNFIGGR